MTCETLEKLLGGGEILQEITGLLVGDLAKLPDFTSAGRAHKAVGLQDGHAVVNVTHDDELPIGCSDIGAGAVPVHVQKSHLQGFLAKEPQTHLLILQDLLHRDQSVA